MYQLSASTTPLDIKLNLGKSSFGFDFASSWLRTQSSRKSRRINRCSDCPKRCAYAQWDCMLDLTLARETLNVIRQKLPHPAFQGEGYWGNSKLTEVIPTVRDKVLPSLTD